MVCVRCWGLLLHADNVGSFGAVAAGETKKVALKYKRMPPSPYHLQLAQLWLAGQRTFVIKIAGYSSVELV